MRKLNPEKRITLLTALVEGNSINAISRMCAVSKITVLRLLADTGTFCARYHNLTVREVASKPVQVDEIWSFCGCKDKAKDAGAAGHGSVWTWTGIDADSKLCIGYLVGLRTPDDAKLFMLDLASRISTRVQLTSDGLKAYLAAVDEAFHGDIDYAMLVKLYGSESGQEAERKYSPAVCKGCKREV